MRPPGPALVLYAALSFAAANAFAKALYLRGCTLVSVFSVRCLVVYLWNGALTAVREGCTTSCRVLTLRTGKLASNRMATVRGLVGAMTGIGLNLSFVFLTFADGFMRPVWTVALGTVALGTVVLGTVVLVLVMLVLVLMVTFSRETDETDEFMLMIIICYLQSNTFIPQMTIEVVSVP